MKLDRNTLKECGVDPNNYEEVEKHKKYMRKSKYKEFKDYFILYIALALYTSILLIWIVGCIGLIPDLLMWKFIKYILLPSIYLLPLLYHLVG